MECKDRICGNLHEFPKKKFCNYFYCYTFNMSSFYYLILLLYLQQREPNCTEQQVHFVSLIHWGLFVIFANVLATHVVPWSGIIWIIKKNFHCSDESPLKRKRRWVDEHLWVKFLHVSEICYNFKTKCGVLWNNP